MSSHYSIRAVAEETGLTVETLRAWERRYGVIAPVRTATNRRVYDATDVNRLKLMRKALDAGHRIGMIANLSLEELHRLLRVDAGAPEQNSGVDPFLESCLSMIRALDADRLNVELTRASSVLGIDRFVHELVLPLVRAIDEGWTGGKLGIAEEHLFSALVKTHLDRLRLSMQTDRFAPMLVVATPTGHLHEIGAMLAALAAARAGWGVTYLGPNLPAADISLAARRTGASAVAISLVFPSGSPDAASELRALRSLLPSNVRIIVGGNAVSSYADVIDEIEGIICQDLGELRAKLAGANVAAAVGF